ncbi:hypothetical protein BLOT_000590 [Blomia tropicalis]|nr:hypothetical protein BLOT_000590 [Blomia tropicalis]
MRPGYQTNTRLEDISKRKHISLIVLFLTFNDAQINGHFHLKEKLEFVRQLLEFYRVGQTIL